MIIRSSNTAIGNFRPGLLVLCGIVCRLLSVSPLTVRRWRQSTLSLWCSWSTPLKIIGLAVCNYSLFSTGQLAFSLYTDLIYLLSNLMPSLMHLSSELAVRSRPTQMIHCGECLAFFDRVVRDQWVRLLLIAISRRTLINRRVMKIRKYGIGHRNTVRSFRWIERSITKWSNHIESLL